MEKTTTVVPFRQVDSVDDPLTEIAREGARRMLAVAMGVEADAFVAQHSGVALPDGRQRVVRHGHGPMRRIQTGVGPLEVQRPKVRETASTSPPRSFDRSQREPILKRPLTSEASLKSAPHLSLGRHKA